MLKDTAGRLITPGKNVDVVTNSGHKLTGLVVEITGTPEERAVTLANPLWANWGWPNPTSVPWEDIADIQVHTTVSYVY